ncbi:MAG: NAD(P)-binding domain-containing protein, partial [Balneolaceae bacterium]
MKISVLGCGWLGYPLSRHLVKKGHRVCGSTTSVKKLDLLKAAGITPCLIEVSARAESDRPETGQVESGHSEAGHLVSDECESFWDANMLFVNIPPGRSRGDVLSRHPSEIAVIAARAEER